MTNVVAAGVCQCLTDFFRNQNGLNETCPENQAYEDVSFDCTSKYLDCMSRNIILDVS